MRDEQKLVSYGKNIKRLIHWIRLEKTNVIKPFKLELKSLQELYTYCLKQIKLTKSFLKKEPDCSCIFHFRSEIEEYSKRLDPIQEQYKKTVWELKFILKNYGQARTKLETLRIKSWALESKILVPSVAEALYSYSDLVLQIFVILLSFYICYIAKKNGKS